MSQRLPEPARFEALLEQVIERAASTGSVPTLSVLRATNPPTSARMPS